MILNNIFTHVAKSYVLLKCMAKRMAGKLFCSADAYKQCLNIMNAFLVTKRRYYNDKARFFRVNGLGPETKQMWLKPCMTPVSNRGRFLSLLYSFSMLFSRDMFD